MNKQQLKQVKNIKSEIEVIKNQIYDIEPTMCKDKVKGSCSEFPYTQRSFSIEGIDIDEYDKKVERLQRRLLKKKEELLSAVEEMQSFIDSIPDSLTRQIIVLRYEQCLSWNEIADKVGGDYTTDRVRKIAERFLNKL